MREANMLRTVLHSHETHTMEKCQEQIFVKFYSNSHTYAFIAGRGVKLATHLHSVPNT
jgi:hypothetical protein